MILGKVYLISFIYALPFRYFQGSASNKIELPLVFPISHAKQQHNLPQKSVDIINLDNGLGVLICDKRLGSAIDSPRGHLPIVLPASLDHPELSPALALLRFGEIILQQ